MLRRTYRTALLSVFAVALVVAGLSVRELAAQDQDDKKPKYTVKEVMKKAFKGGLVRKVAGGRAAEKEQQTLIAMLEAISKAKVKKGDEKSWKEKTSLLLTAAKEVKKGEKGAGAKLIKAANCKACHTKHK